MKLEKFLFPIRIKINHLSFIVTDIFHNLIFLDLISGISLFENILIHLSEFIHMIVFSKRSNHMRCLHGDQHLRYFILFLGFDFLSILSVEIFLLCLLYL